uniref:Uncharacterized protein n=1 Tax=Cacopsylla melanoneura TaxID=428564 RepID=A0A8D8RET7_9HEMI
MQTMVSRASVMQLVWTASLPARAALVPTYRYHLVYLIHVTTVVLSRGTNSITRIPTLLVMHLLILVALRTSKALPILVNYPSRNLGLNLPLLTDRVPNSVRCAAKCSAMRQLSPNIS